MFNTLLPISARPVSLGQLAHDVDRLFEMTTRSGSTPGETAHPAWPGLNAWQDGNEFFVEAEIPGFGIDNIQVDVAEKNITIRGHREMSTPQGSTTLRRERSISRFERSLRLPAPVDPEAVDASLSNGVLQIRLPIAQSARPRRIQINAGDQSLTSTNARSALPANTPEQTASNAS